MSLRPLRFPSNSYYAQFFRSSLLARPALLSTPKSSSCLRDSHSPHSWLRRASQLASQATLSQGNPLGDLSKPTQATPGRDQSSSAQPGRNGSSALNGPALCAHCGGKTIPKIRKPVEPGNPSSGWHCKPCLRNIRVHGHLPNEEQLVAINRRRLIRESGEASKKSPCRHCGELTAPKSSRKFVEPDNPSAGFHCRSCVRHMHHHGALPDEDELAAFKSRKKARSRAHSTCAHHEDAEVTGSLKAEPEPEPESPISSSPKSPKQVKQSRDPYPCRHCGDTTFSNSKRRLVEPQNPSAGYYCQPCTRCLLETDSLPTNAQLAALKKLRAKRTTPPSARGSKIPCTHCGDITAPGSKRKLVEPKNPAGGYYCRPCAECLVETNALPDKARLTIRKSREQARLSNIQASLNASIPRIDSSPEGEPQVGDTFKSCAHCKTGENVTTIKYFAPLNQDICSSCVGHFDLHGSFPKPEVLSRRDNMRKARVRIQADIQAGRPLACSHCKEPRPQNPNQHWKIGGQFFDLVCPRCQGKGF